MSSTPELVRFLVRHAAVGFAISAAFVGLILAADPNGLGTLLAGAAGHPMPLVLLWFFCGLTFASVQIGAAVMLLGEDDGGGRGRRSPVAPPGLTLRPVPVRVRPRVRR
jgi:hypothetical protein